MYKKVVWATDGSAAADDALIHARALAQESGGQLLAIHCDEYTLPGKGGGSYSVSANEEDLEAKIERQVKEMSGNGISASFECVRRPAGGVPHAIADYAKAEQADLIVAGTRGHTPLVGLIVGSVTTRLMHIAPCPVLAVRPAEGH
jgi:nucleotide-binding universal stress UspA family protein